MRYVMGAGAGIWRFIDEVGLKPALDEEQAAFERLVERERRVGSN